MKLVTFTWMDTCTFKSPLLNILNANAVSQVRWQVGVPKRPIYFFQRLSYCGLVLFSEGYSGHTRAFELIQYISKIKRAYL